MLLYITTVMYRTFLSTTPLIDIRASYPAKRYWSWWIADILFKLLLQNFVGLSVSDGYIATGSETNEVSFCIHFFYVYYCEIPHRFDSRRVLKTLRETSKEKVHRGHYLLTVDLAVTNGIRVKHWAVCQQERWPRKGWTVISHIDWRGGGLWDPTLVGEGTKYSL